MDGPTLWMLASSGSREQMQACGIRKLKDELTLKRLVLNENACASKPWTPTCSTSSAVAD